jgi:hypothetical protein
MLHPTSIRQGPNEGPIEDHSGSTLVSCTCDAYQELFEIVHTAFSVEQFEHLIFQIQKYRFTDEQWSKLKLYWIAVDLDSPIANGTNFPICSNKIN